MENDFSRHNKGRCTNDQLKTEKKKDLVIGEM